jgi:hypothetical protein
MSVTMSGALAGALTPSPTKTVYPNNYLGASPEYVSQFLPDVHEKEFSKYGNRSVSSFLRRVGAEVPFASDFIQWAEQGRLHLAVTGATRSADVITKAAHPFRANQTVIIKDADGTQEKAIVLDNSSLTADTFAVASYENENLASALATTGLSVFAFGSEFKQGTGGMDGSLDAPKDIQTVKPIIIKDKFSVSGSQMAQISWIEVETDQGSGYFWYLKSESETRKRFEDYLELSLIEGREAASGSGALSAGFAGTKGLFRQVETRGNISTGAIEARADIEAYIKVLDKEGAIQENVMFVNREKSFEIDTVLAAQSNYGTSGASYGMFDNDEMMALSLGFKGFNLGYDFYKTDWKYLNDATTGGLTSGVDGLIVPAGTTSVYDEVMGESVVLPFLHVKYRKTANEDRKYKSWLVGSAGGANNSDEDAMNVHFLSERALCVMGANNFILLK